MVELFCHRNRWQWNSDLSEFHKNFKAIYFLRILGSESNFNIDFNVIRILQKLRQEFLSENQQASPNNNFNLVSKKREKSELNKFIKFHGYQHKSPWDFPLKFFPIKSDFCRRHRNSKRIFSRKPAINFDVVSKKEKKIEQNMFVKFRGWSSDILRRPQN